MSLLRAVACAVPVCCAVAACGSSPPTHYYTLKMIAPAAATTATPATTQIALRLEPVAIPAELDRLELVSRTGPYRVQIANSDRWAAPLEDQIRRTLSDDLAARLPPGAVVDPNEPATGEPRRLLSVAIAEFFADDHCAASLRGDWTLRVLNSDSEHGTERIQLPGSETCIGAEPAAMSSALAVLADRLAAVIAAQPAITGAVP